MSQRTFTLVAATPLLVAAALWAVLGIGARVVRTRVLPRLETRIGRAIRAREVRMRWGLVELRALEVDGEGGAPPLVVPRLCVRLRMAPLIFGRVEIAQVELDYPLLQVVRYPSGEDNFSSILARLHHAGSAAGQRARLTIDKVRVVGGAAVFIAADTGEARAGIVDAELNLNGAGTVRARDLSLRLGAGPRLNAAELAASLTLAHGRLWGLPTVEIRGAAAAPWTGFELTGISGSWAPDPAAPQRALLELHGSYGGAEQPLWNASGSIHPFERTGKIQLRAASFKLSQLDAVLKRKDGSAQVLDTGRAELDARLDLAFADGVLDWDGSLHLAGLTVGHPGLAAVPVPGLAFDARTRGRLDIKQRRLRLTEMVVDFRRLHARLTAEAESQGPRFAATLQIRPLLCQTALEALPPELVPALQGFRLHGTFSTDLRVGVSYWDVLGASVPLVDLGGRVGIEGCTVLEAPDTLSADRLNGSFLETVELEPGRWLSFVVGPENPDWVPLAEVSPHLVNSIMTTEDSAFFKHHGFITSEFRSALQQNLQRGYFRLGASSITMQMVKNVLLSREKTLSRKLQEMFLTWYVEHHLAKERILEIYLNVIEFGPGIYGIGRAAHHYFGKPPKELEPQEAAWFSSILPSPKRRYVQFCHDNGQPDAKWSNYLRRILRRMHERGRLSDEEFERANTTPLQFARAEALPEKECVEWVKRLTGGLQPAASPQPTADARQ